jgi:hypothetical protein
MSLILGIALLLPLFFPQLPQSAPKPKTSNARPQVNAQPQAKLAPTSPAQPSTNTPNQVSDHVAAKNEPQIVQVESVKRDWLDKWTLGVSAALLLVGIIGTYVALNTLFEIREEVKHATIIAEAARDNVTATLDNAKAAWLNAQAVINSERAWIDVNGIAIPDRGWIRQENPERYRAFTDADAGFCFFRIQNKGRTPAQFISGTIQKAFVNTPNDLPVPAIYDAPFNSPNETFLVPGEYFDPRPFANPKAIIEQRSVADAMFNSNQILIFYGQVSYEDVISGGRHETRWCYAWFDGRGLIRTGPDGEGYKEYNRYS